MEAASGNAVVCAWSEGVRHGARKNGYHGGVSAQEVVVSLSVFTPRKMVLKGWQMAPAPQPDWWAPLEATWPAAAAATPSPARKAAKPGAVAAPQPDLFGGALPVVAPEPDVDG